jgi:hypothetical protein
MEANEWDYIQREMKGFIKDGVWEVSMRAARL